MNVKETKDIIIYTLNISLFQGISFDIALDILNANCKSISIPQSSSSIFELFRTFHKTDYEEMDNENLKS